MRWLDKRYHTLNYELRSIFGQKVIKLSLDGGFTCPNRDGTIGTKGCVFCSEEGSGEFSAPRYFSIKKQIQQQKDFLSPKWQTGKYIAYFQNYTNTYGPVDELRKIYEEALSCEGVVGLAIATRPDCLSKEVIDLLEELSKKAYVWIELGLQTIHEKTAKFLRRGYSLDVFESAISMLKEKRINAVVHLILGLPGESYEDILQSVRYIAKVGTQGVKLHLLHVLEGTDLKDIYEQEKFHLLSKEQYISLVVDVLELLPPEMVIHRVTGDGAKDLLVGPRWSLDKLSVLSGIDKEFKKRDSYQGIKYANIIE